MAPRAVALVLNLPHMRAGVFGGGRGSRHTRRVSPKTRNAVAIVQALSEAGLSLELATNIIAATPIVADEPTAVIDFQAFAGGVRSLLMFDPSGNWLPTDIVPEHVWERYVVRCKDINKPDSGPGGIYYIDANRFLPGQDGMMHVDRAGHGTLTLKPLTGEPEYYGEIDPLGMYLPESSHAVAVPRIDDHLLILNGRWVVSKNPDPSPMEAMQALVQGDFNRGREIKYRFDPVSVIEQDRKTVRTIGWGRDNAEQDRAHSHLMNFDSMLDVNLTLAVRKMKRRAYGLPVDGEAKS